MLRLVEKLEEKLWFNKDRLVKYKFKTKNVLLRMHY